MEIDFYHIGVPLAQCCSLYTPFIISWVKNFFRREFEQSGKKYPVKNREGNIIFVELEDPELYFNDELAKAGYSFNWKFISKCVENALSCKTERNVSE